MLKGFFFAHDPEEERGERKEERGERKVEREKNKNIRG
jgi:hypothetical protein